MDTFRALAGAHLARHPYMTPRDLGKLAYQSCFGPAHLLADPQSARAAILREWEGTPAGRELPPEDIGGGLCRFHLNDIPDKDLGAQILVKLFILTAKEGRGSAAQLEKMLCELESIPLPGMGEWLADYRAQGCPPVSHSGAYRAACDPRYRLLKWEYAAMFPALLELGRLARRGGGVLAAADGRCGSGKSTLARLAAEVLGYEVVRTDDFFLPKDRRAENWRDIPGGNMDLERLRQQVLSPLRRGEGVCYRPFCCSTGAPGERQFLSGDRPVLLEGSYSHHPDLRTDFDLRLFVTCGEDRRLERLREREGDYFPVFLSTWIPMEERYFARFDTEHSADLVVDTTGPL